MNYFDVDLGGDVVVVEFGDDPWVIIVDMKVEFVWNVCCHDPWAIIKILPFAGLILNLGNIRLEI